jgi:hypothetical protein
MVPTKVAVAVPIPEVLVLVFISVPMKLSMQLVKHEVAQLLMAIWNKSESYHMGLSTASKDALKQQSTCSTDESMELLEDMGPHQSIGACRKAGKMSNETQQSTCLAGIWP